MNRCHGTGWNAAVVLAGLAASGVAQAAAFTAANEAELITAINQANASADPSSTITLTANFTVTGVLPPIRGNVAVNPAGSNTAVESVGGAALTFEGGASYGTLGNLQVGDAAGTTGALTVQGTGSSVRAVSLLGSAGQVNISVLDGGLLTATGPSGVRLGGTSPTVSGGGVANVRVSGAGSAFTSGVGFVHQRGTLEVSNGGTVEGRAAVHLGSMPGGFTGVVTGAGSRLASTIATINLGASGSATLTVADGAVLSANNGASAVNLAANAAGVAVLNIGGAVGQAAVAPGAVNASVVNGGAGTAVLNFNHNAAAYSFAPAITGSISLNHVGSGTTTLTRASTYSGATHITGGTLRAGVANAFSAASAHTVGASGALDAGDFDQTLSTLNNAGTVSLPGGTLTMTGAYVGQGGTLRVGTAPGAGGLASGRLVLSGAGASATGTTLLGIANFGGPPPAMASRSSPPPAAPPPRRRPPRTRSAWPMAWWAAAPTSTACTRPTPAARARTGTCVPTAFAAKWRCTRWCPSSSARSISPCWPTAGSAWANRAPTPTTAAASARPGAASSAWTATSPNRAP